MTVLPAGPAQPGTAWHGGSGNGYSRGCRCDPCRKANSERAARRRAERYTEPKDPDDPRHGKPSFYSNHGCRCDKCLAAHREKCKAEWRRRPAAARPPRPPRIPGAGVSEAVYRAARYAAPKDPRDPRHGKASFYVNHGCRCDKCRAGHAKATAQRSARRRIRETPGPELVDRIAARRLHNCLLNGPHQYTATTCARCGL